MKGLSPTRNLCVRQHARSPCALPFYKTRLAAFSSLFFAGVLHLRHFLLSPCRLLCSAPPPRRIPTPHLPSIEFPHGPRPPQRRAARFKLLYRPRDTAPGQR